MPLRTVVLLSDLHVHPRYSPSVRPACYCDALSAVDPRSRTEVALILDEHLALFDGRAHKQTPAVDGRACDLEAANQQSSREAQWAHKGERSGTRIFSGRNAGGG